MNTKHSNCGDFDLAMVVQHIAAGSASDEEVAWMMREILGPICFEVQEIVESEVEDLVSVLLEEFRRSKHSEAANLEFENESTANTLDDSATDGVQMDVPKVEALEGTTIWEKAAAIARTKDPAVANGSVYNYLRKCGVRFLKKKARLAWDALADDVRDECDKLVKHSSGQFVKHKDATGRVFYCCALEVPAGGWMDLTAVVIATPLRKAEGEPRAKTGVVLPTRPQLAEVCADFLKKCGLLSVAQLTDAAKLVFQVSLRGQFTSIDAPGADNAPPLTPSVPPKQVDGHNPRLAEMLATRLLETVARNDNAVIPNHETPVSPAIGHHIFHLLTYSLWAHFPIVTGGKLTGVAYKEYTGVPNATIGDREELVHSLIQKAVCHFFPDLAIVLAQSKRGANEDHPAFPVLGSALDRLRRKFFHWKPEIVVGTGFN